MHLYTFSRFQKYLWKSFQFFCRAEHNRIWQADIHLHHFCAISVTSVGNQQADSCLIYFQIRICKFRIGQSVPEGILHPYLARVIIPVSHVNALPVLCISLCAGKMLECRCILVPDRITLRKPSGWIDFSSQNIQHGAGSCLSIQISMKDRLAAGMPWHLHRCSRTHDAYNIFVYLHNRLQKFNLILRNSHVRTVQTFRFTEFIQSKTVQHNLCLGCNIQCLFF